MGLAGLVSERNPDPSTVESKLPLCMKGCVCVVYMGTVPIAKHFGGCVASSHVLCPLTASECYLMMLTAGQVPCAVSLGMQSRQALNS